MNVDHKRQISVIGLGYVGLPVAVAFGKLGPVIGLDRSAQRIASLRVGIDRTGEVDPSDLQASDVRFTNDPADLKAADFHIVAVPTPIDEARQPDLSPLLGATKTVADQLKAGDIVVYESTVYPGATEEDCIPILEARSGLKAGVDFHVGYSPERINPGDTVHKLSTVVKVVSAQSAESLEIVAAVYESVVEAGVHRAATIRVAEAAKVIENTQRDLNIALMNELALIFNRMDIETRDVLAAAQTKWNFLPFQPGLVGGHCIGVDPYYLTHKAERLGYSPQVILAGRRINDGLGQFVAGQVVKHLIAQGSHVKDSRVTVLGLTFKEDVPDLRNTRIIDIVHELQEYGIRVQVTDPLADPDEATEEYGIRVLPEDDLEPAEGVVAAVAQQDYVARGWSLVGGLLKGGRGVVCDVKGFLPRDNTPDGIALWRL